MANKSTSARVSREQNRSDCARIMRRSLDQRDICQLAIADVCGVDQQIAQRWCSPNDPHTPTVADLRQLPKDVALDLLRWAAEAHGLTVVPADDHHADLASPAELSETVQRASALSVAHATALADGKVDADEARSILRAAEAMQASAQELINGARAVIRDHDRSVRLVPRREGT